MRRFIETAYAIAAIAPLVWLGLVIAQIEGSLVSGIAVGAMIPLLAAVSLLLVLVGLTLIFLAHRENRRIWHLVLATLMSSPLAVLVGFTWLLG